MKNRFILRALLVGALVVQTLLPAFAAAPALKILSASPKGKLYAGGRYPVSVSFNQPVAALGEKTEFSSAD